MGLSLGQTPTGIVDDGISSIIMSLVEDSPQARHIIFSVQLERLGKISIGQNGFCGTQTLQFIKWLLEPVILGDGHPLLACILARHQFKQGSGYLCELGDKLATVPQESKWQWQWWGGPLLMASIFPSLVTIYWAEMMSPRYVICLQNSSHLEGLSFSLACSSFWNMASCLSRWLPGSFEKMTISSR